MTIINTARGFSGPLFFMVVACSAQAALLKIIVGEKSLVLDSRFIEQVVAGEDVAGNSYVRLTLSEHGMSTLAGFTENPIGKELEIFHGAKRVFGKVTLRDKLAMKEIFISVENKTAANQLAESIESGLRPRAAPY